MSNENESARDSKSSKGTSRTSQLANNRNKVNVSKNEHQTHFEEKYTKIGDDANLDNVSFSSDDTVELISDANNYLYEDENLVENEKLLLTEPKYHKNLKCVTRVNLHRSTTNVSSLNNVNTNTENLNDSNKNQTGSYFFLSIFKCCF